MIARRSIMAVGLLAWVLGVLGCSTESPKAATTAMDSLSTQRASEPDWLLARRAMVDRQLAARGIINQAVLEAMAEVPRHRFVPAELRDAAYEDNPLPIGHNQTISQPYIVAYMTEVLELRPEHRILEIGTGSGYQAAVLSKLAETVYSIEIIPELAAQARETLLELGYANVEVKAGNGYEGWVEHAPYDRIIVTAAPESIPQDLVDQLADNGRLVIPVGRWSQEIVILTKANGHLTEQRTIPVRFVPMTGKPKG